MRSAFFAAAAIAAMPLAAQEDTFYLDILRVEVEMGHVMAFREGVQAYMECYDEAGGKDTWSTWTNMDGDGIVYHFVSRMDNWAVLDEREDARRDCYPVIEEQVAPHMVSMNTTYVKHLPDWSAEGEMEDWTVARVHYFNVEDRQKFRAAIGAVAEVWKAAETDEDPGMWYAIQGGTADDADYFVVERHMNFASMDEDASGPYGTLKEHTGEDAADLIWDQYLESLEEGNGYWSSLLVYQEDLSRSGGS